MDNTSVNQLGLTSETRVSSGFVLLCVYWLALHVLVPLW